MMWFYYVSVRLSGVCVLVCVPLSIANTLDNNVGDDECTRNVFFIWYPRRLNFDSILGAGRRSVGRFHCCCCCYAIIIIITPLGTLCYGQCQKIYSHSDASEFLTHVISGKIAVLFFPRSSVCVMLCSPFVLHTNEIVGVQEENKAHICNLIAGAVVVCPFSKVDSCLTQIHISDECVFHLYYFENRKKQLTLFSIRS